MIIFSETQHYSVLIFLTCALPKAQCERCAGRGSNTLGAEDNAGQHHRFGTTDAKIRIHVG